MNLRSFPAIVSVLLLISSAGFSQFNKPIITVGIGISAPYNELKGDYYSTSTFFRGYPILTINPELFASNYGAKTGMYFFGAAKINFDKYSITRGFVSVSYNTFNTFESRKRGNLLLLIVDPNNQVDTVLSSAEYNYYFRNFGVALGLEIAPLSFTNLVTPFIGGSISFNVPGATLSRTENGIDTVSTDISEFRIGFNINAGLEFKLSKNFGLLLGFKYDLGNVLLRSNYGGIADRYEWGKNNAPLNDEEGYFFSSLPVIIGTPIRMYESNTKKINWGTIYLGFNFYLDIEKPKKKKEKEKSGLF